MQPVAGPGCCSTSWLEFYLILLFDSEGRIRPRPGGVLWLLPLHWCCRSLTGERARPLHKTHHSCNTFGCRPLVHRHQMGCIELIPSTTDRATQAFIKKALPGRSVSLVITIGLTTSHLNILLLRWKGALDAFPQFLSWKGRRYLTHFNPYERSNRPNVGVYCCSLTSTLDFPFQRLGHVVLALRQRLPLFIEKRKVHVTGRLHFLIIDCHDAIFRLNSAFCGMVIPA